MSIGIYDIKRSLFKKIKNEYITCKEERFFEDVKLISKIDKHFEKNFIYVGKLSMLKNSLDIDENITFILESDENIDTYKTFTKKVNIIEIEKDEDILEVYNDIRELFFEDREVLNCKAMLLNLLIEGKGIKNIVKASSNILKNPLVLIDSSYKVLEYHNICDIKDKFWVENINKGYCSYEFISAVKKIISRNKNFNSEKPYEFICTESPIHKLICKIKIDNKAVGNIILLECKNKFKERDSEILEVVSKVIGEEMKKDSFYRNVNNLVYENFILDLLNEKLTDRESFNERLKTANLNLSKNLSLLVFNIKYYESKDKYTGYLIEKLKSFFPLVNPVYYNDKIIIINDNNKFNKSSKLYDKVSSFLFKNKIYVGVSRSFEDMYNCKKYYVQGLKALQIGKILNSKKCINFYSDIQLYGLFSNEYKDRDYEEWYHPALLILKEYDKLKKTDFYNTLYIFIKNNKNMEKTSEELFIHRNTTRYRLQKIQELTSINLDNMDDILNIYMSYKITMYFEKLNKE